MLGTGGVRFTALDGLRTALKIDGLPDQSINLIAQVAAPQTAGSYVVQWDVVEENVLWFSWRGSPVAASFLTVAGLPVSSVQAPPLLPAAHAPDTPELDRLTLWKVA